MALGTANGTKFVGITASATTPSITTASSGSGIYVHATWTRLTTFSSISDSKGNTYVQIGSEIDDGTLYSKSRVYYCANATGGSGHTVTVNLAGSRGITVLVTEITTTNGLGVALDQQNQANDTSTPFTAAITPTSQPQLLLSAFNGDSATIVTHDPTANGFALVSGCEETDADAFWTSAIASKSITSTSSVTASWTSTGTGGNATRAAVFVAGFSEVAASGAVSGSTSLTFSPSGVLTGVGALAGSSALTFSSAGNLAGVGSLAGSSILTFTPSGFLMGTAPISGASSLTFDANGVLAGLALASGSSSLLFTPSGVLAGTGALAGSSGIIFLPEGMLGGFGSLSGSTTLTFDVSGLLSGAAEGAVSGSCDLTFSTVGNLTGTGALSGSSSLSFTVSGSMAVHQYFDAAEYVEITTAYGSATFYNNGAGRFFRIA